MKAEKIERASLRSAEPAGVFDTIDEEADRPLKRQFTKMTIRGVRDLHEDRLSP